MRAIWTAIRRIGWLCPCLVGLPLAWIACLTIESTGAPSSDAAVIDYPALVHSIKDNGQVLIRRPGANVRIRGGGRTLDLEHGKHNALWIECKSLTIEDLTFANPPGTVIKAIGESAPASECILRKVRVTGRRIAGQGLLVRRFARLAVEDCSFESLGESRAHHAIYCTSAHEVSIERCQFRDIAGAAIQIAARDAAMPVQAVTIDRCHFVRVFRVANISAENEAECYQRGVRLVGNDVTSVTDFPLFYGQRVGAHLRAERNRWRDLARPFRTGDGLLTLEEWIERVEPTAK